MRASDAPPAELAGKVVLITGAGAGLGRAYAQSAAAHGASVVVNDIDGAAAAAVTAAIRAAGGKAVADAHSVSEWGQAGQMVEHTVEAFGRIDGLVNNAGVTHIGAPWEDDEQILRRVIETNLLGTLFCTAQTLPHMVRQRSGAIVNVGSVAQAGASSLVGYSASKGGVASATSSLATDCARHGIRVNLILPSADTEMVPREQRAARAGPEWDPALVAPLVVYLLSDRSRGLNGVMLRFALGELRSWHPPGPDEQALKRPSWMMEDFDTALKGHGLR